MRERCLTRRKLTLLRRACTNAKEDCTAKLLAKRLGQAMFQNHREPANVDTFDTTKREEPRQ